MPGGRRQPSSHLGRPVGRAIARTYAYPIRVVLAVKRAARVDRRYVHSRYIRPNHPERAIARYGAHIVRALQAVARMARVDRRRVRSLRTRFVRPGAVPRPPQHIRSYLVRRRRPSPRISLRRPVGRAIARPFPYPIRTTLQSGKRAAHPLRRRVRSVRVQPVGRAIARLVAYPVKVVLQAGKRSYRLRFKFRSLLRKAFGAAAPPVSPAKVIGSATPLYTVIGNASTATGLAVVSVIGSATPTYSVIGTAAVIPLGAVSVIGSATPLYTVIGTVWPV